MTVDPRVLVNHGELSILYCSGLGLTGSTRKFYNVRGTDRRPGRGRGRGKRAERLTVGRIKTDKRERERESEREREREREREGGRESQIYRDRQTGTET